MKDNGSYDLKAKGDREKYYCKLYVLIVKIDEPDTQS